MTLRYLPLFSALIGLCSALLMASCQQSAPQAQQKIEVPDSLALRIACLPTYESLPFYYAQAAGIADSLSLPLKIKTYYAQFDADTALLGTTVDGGVTDVVRQQYYATQGKMRNYASWIPLQGQWQLVVGGRLRVTEVKQLKQRTIAIARFATSDRYTAYLRDSLRWKYDDMLRPQINDYRVRLQMLDNEQIEAAVLPQPFALRAQQSGQRVLTTLPSSQHTFYLWLSPKSQADKRKSQQAQLLQRVYNEAVRELNSRPRAALDSVLLKRYQLTPEQVRMVKLPRYNPVKASSTLQ